MAWHLFLREREPFVNGLKREQLVGSGFNHKHPSPVVGSKHSEDPLAVPLDVIETDAVLPLASMMTVTSIGMRSVNARSTVAQWSGQSERRRSAPTPLIPSDALGF